MEGQNPWPWLFWKSVYSSADETRRAPLLELVDGNGDALALHLPENDGGYGLKPDE